VHVGVNATGGVIYLKRDSDESQSSLYYGGLGGSLGVGFIPFPGDLSFSLPQMPNAGVVYTLPRSGGSLTLSDFKGLCLTLELEGHFGPGAGGSMMFMGASEMLAAALGPSLLVPVILATAKACVSFGGMTAGLIPGNASITALMCVII